MKNLMKVNSGFEPVSLLSKQNPYHLKSSNHHKAVILRLFLLSKLNYALHRFYQNNIAGLDHYMTEEDYLMETKLIQTMIHEILQTGDYTLEGIAYHTRIPYDVVYDAACGINQQLSMLAWSKMVRLFLQTKPEVAKVLNEKLVNLLTENDNSMQIILNS